MRVLLTGSTGLIGASVSECLRPHHSLHTLGRQAALVDEVVDLSDPAAVARVRIPASECLVHCAGITDEDFKADPMTAYRRATLGVEALLDAAARAGCRRFIYISSTHVYGSQVGCISEDSPADPLSHYALAHYCTEQLFRRYAASCGRTPAILRPNAVFGLPVHRETFQRWSLIPFSFPREAKLQGRIVLKSSGLQRRNFVSTAAVADVVARCINGDLVKESGIINVVGVETESVYDFAHRCRKFAEEQTGHPCVVERSQSYVDAPDALAGSDFSLVSRFDQRRPTGELTGFIRQLIESC